MSDAATPDVPTCAICTLGCKVNQYDSGRIARQMRAKGFRLVPFRQFADVYIIDTCTVTRMADQKSRKAVGRAARKNPQAVIAVTGCAAERAQDQFRNIFEEAIVVGNRRKDELAALVVRALRRWRDLELPARAACPPDGPRAAPPAGRTRAILKVMDGCHRACAFCIIPRVRGRPRSRPFAEVLQEARQMAEGGAREIVLTGVILGWYGSDLPPLNGNGRKASRGQLPALLRALKKIEGLRRIRLSALDPRDVSDELFETMAARGKVMPHLHLVLQSGCDATLRAMRRGYTAARYAECVGRLRAALPRAGLYTDVIAGFPGESEAHFEETLDFVRTMRFSGMHIFPFSTRPGTEAARLPDPVPPAIVAERARRLARVERESRAVFAASHLQRRETILVERPLPGGGWDGLTETYVRVRASGGNCLHPGDLAAARLECWNKDHLAGRIV